VKLYKRPTLDILNNVFVDSGVRAFERKRLSVTSSAADQQTFFRYGASCLRVCCTYFTLHRMFEPVFHAAANGNTEQVIVHNDEQHLM